MTIVLLSGLVVAILYATVAAQTALKMFMASSKNYDTATPIDNPQQVENIFDCIRTCYHSYTECFSVTFHTTSGLCTPRSWITFDISSPPRDSAELFYYTDICQTRSGFRLFRYKSVVQCLYVSSKKKNFAVAREICSQKGSRLILIKSQDKLDLLRNIVSTITRGQTWIGLTGLITNRTFAWDDNEPLDLSLYSMFWRPPYNPDNYLGIEDCCEIGSIIDQLFVNDNVCALPGKFVCEMDITLPPVVPFA